MAGIDWVMEVRLTTGETIQINKHSADERTIQNVIIKAVGNDGTVWDPDTLTGYPARSIVSVRRHS